MNAPVRGGASASARECTASIDLSTLARLLGECLAVPSDAKGAGACPFAILDGRRLRINLRGVLQRLFAHPEFDRSFSPSPAGESGFLRDIELPPRGTIARVGGRIVPGTEVQTSRDVEALARAIGQELARVVSAEKLSTLTFPSSRDATQALTDSLRIRPPQQAHCATVVPVEFASGNRTAAQHEKDVARVLSAIETIDGRDWLGNLIGGLENLLKTKGYDEEVIDAIGDELRQQRQQPGSQIRRFLEFLDDEALSRVRLQVTFSLMQAVASNCRTAGLKAYVARVLKAYELFGSATGRELALNVATHYGQRNCSNLAEFLQQALFYSVLPVWAQWSVQIFEARTEAERGFATQREVSYRFRVNGINPAEGKSAFAARLDRHEESLLNEFDPNANVKRAIAELVFLRLVVPDNADAPSDEDMVAKAAAIAEALTKQPQGAVKRLIEQLRAREPVMQGIAADLIGVLQSRAGKLVSDANRAVDRFFVTVHRRIVDEAALVSMNASTDVLVKTDSGQDHIAWFAHLAIARDPAEVNGSIASYWVETRLTERSITPAGSSQSLRVERDTGRPVLPIRLAAFYFDAKAADVANRWAPANDLVTTCDFGAGIDLEYDVKSLRLSRNEKDEKRAAAEQKRTAAACAFALVAYLSCWAVVHRLKAIESIEHLSASFLRLQPGGKDVEADSGVAVVYTAAQAIERALSRELPVKLQGLDTHGADRTERYRKTGAVAGLIAGCPIRIGASGNLQKVAVISYATRPCDSHPLRSDDDAFVYVSRTFTGVREPSGDLYVSADAMQLKLAPSKADFRVPHAIHEEIARIHQAGYRHVVLLSHHFGNRHIGRAAERHAPHATVRFLEEVSRRFPDVMIYPLRRDVFPATRLRKRTSTESGFEVTSFKDHMAMYDEHSRNVLSGQVPVYTFATLAVVGETGRPQSGFCTYFLDVREHPTDVEWKTRIEQDIFGVGVGQGVRDSIVSLLRAIHYLESEKSPLGSQALPVLDPFDWTAPVSANAAGELRVMKRRTSGWVDLSLPALFARVSAILHTKGE